MAANLTQKALANAVGLPTTLVHYVEQERASPLFGSLVRFANFFGVSLDYLLGVDE